MNTKIIAFDDFVDECFLEDDTFCKYENQELDQVLESLVSIPQTDWDAFEGLASWWQEDLKIPQQFYGLGLLVN